MGSKTTERAVRELAAKLAGVTQSVACEGTALESTTFAVGKKNFLFLRVHDGACELRLKLEESKREAEKLAAKDPARFDVGKKGWAKVTFPLGDGPPFDLLRRWIEESHRSCAVGRKDPASRVAR
jgi:hypothetical protein